MWSCVCFETGSLLSVGPGGEGDVQTSSEYSQLLMQVVEVLVSLFYGPIELPMGQLDGVAVTLKCFIALCSISQ
jgi:hypothetical protein